MDSIAASNARRGSSAYLACLWHDAPFHAVVVAYLLVGMVVGKAAGVPHKFNPFTYAGVLLTTTMPTLLLLTMCGLGIRSLKGQAPLKTFGKSLFGPRAVASMALLFSVTVFAGVFVSLKSMLTDVVPFYADPFLADLDRLIHGQDPWLYAKAIVPPSLLTAVGAVYFVGWTVLGWGAVLAALFYPRLRSSRAQVLWTFFIIWSVLGNFLAAAVMSGGPTFYLQITGDARFEALTSYIAEHSPALASARTFLWRSHLGEIGSTGAEISAFPSMHLAQATLVVLLARRIHRWAFAATLVFLGVILMGSVLLGWHYAVDGYFSIAATALIWKLVGSTLQRARTIRLFPQIAPATSSENVFGGAAVADNLSRAALQRDPQSAGQCGG